MTTKQEILIEIQTVVANVPLLAGKSFVYPTDQATIPATDAPLAITGQFFSTTNTTPILASGCATHNWTAEILLIVSWDNETAYPSLDNAAQEALLDDWELQVIPALLSANLSDSVLIEDMASGIGWFQWERLGGNHAPVFGIQILLPVSQEITF